MGVCENEVVRWEEKVEGGCEHVCERGRGEEGRSGGGNEIKLEKLVLSGCHFQAFLLASCLKITFSVSLPANFTQLKGSICEHTISTSSISAHSFLCLALCFLHPPPLSLSLHLLSTCTSHPSGALSPSQGLIQKRGGLEFPPSHNFPYPEILKLSMVIIFTCY